MEKLISVIMSTYNETEDELTNSINSILNQTYENIEFIIVDDNPQNLELYTFLKNIKNEKVTIVYNEHNLGLVNSLNKALSLCKGIYVARMDADDISNINRLKEQVFFLENGNYDLVGSCIELIDENNKHIKYENIPSDSNILVHKLQRRNILPHPTWLGRKRLFDKLNGYRNVPKCEDYDFILRAIKNHYKIGCINSILLKYRIRSSSITQSCYSEQYVLSKFLSKEAKYNSRIEIENIEQYIKSKDYLSDVLSYKKFKYAKDKIKRGKFDLKDIKNFISNKYLIELIKDKLY